jgi:flagellar basal-body rod protein FlgB
MLFGDITLVDMMKQKMRWHEQRQRVLSENVANAETPGYKARDIQAPEFNISDERGIKPVVLAATQSGHIGFASNARLSSADNRQSYEITPEGNAVVLEDEVMRVSQNVMDYQEVSQLYAKGLSVMKLALGRRN